MKNLNRLWFFSKGYRYCLVLLVFIVGVGSYLEILIPKLMSDVLDALNTNSSFNTISKFCATIVLFSFILILEGIGEGFFVSTWSAGVAKNLSNALFSKVLDLQSKDADGFGFATVLTRLTTDTANIRRALQMISSFVKCPLLIIFAITASIRINKELSLIFLIAVPLFAILLVIIIKESRKHFRKMLLHYDEMNQMISENIIAMRTVKSYSKESYQSNKFNKIVDNLRFENYSSEKLTALNSPISKMIINIAILILVWVGSRQIIATNLSVGNLFCLISYTNQILMQALVISLILVPLLTSQISFGRVLEILDVDTIDNNQTNFNEEINTITFKNVGFTYADSSDSNLLLNDVSFEVKANERIGITGPSGSGKTTLLKLLMGLYVPTCGDIFINDTNLKNINAISTSKIFGYAPQKNWLFTGTIKENICAGDNKINAEMVKKACEDACIYDYVTSHPKGFDSIIEEEGKNLSGGQKQRMSLARALVRNLPVIVLDNITSGLDRITEEKVLTNLKQKYSNTTQFIVSDKISSIKDADKIIVINRGKLAGFGTHESLLKECSIYKEMDESQKEVVEDVE